MRIERPHISTARYYRDFIVDPAHEISEDQAQHADHVTMAQFDPNGSRTRFDFFTDRTLTHVEYYGRRDMSETVLRHLAAHRGVRFDVQGVRRPASGYVWECFHNLDGVGRVCLSCCSHLLAEVREGEVDAVTPPVRQC